MELKKAIVTGANGFIGRALCNKLSEENIAVTGIVRTEESKERLFREKCCSRVIVCPLSDINKLDCIIADRDIDVFFHFAWEGVSNEKNADYITQISNIKYSCDAMYICKKMGIKRFVFASSIMEYELEAFMKTESIPTIDMIYKGAKIGANYMLRTIAGDLGIDYIRAVISNVYGVGEFSSRLINSSIRRMLRGEHCSFTSGEQMYDFIYITDAVNEIIAVASKGVSNRTYYIGTPKPMPLKYFLIEMRNQIDEKIELGLGEREYNGVSLSYKEFDIEAVKKDTGYIPEVSFVQGIQKTIQWIRENEK